MIGDLGLFLLKCVCNVCFDFDGGMMRFREPNPMDILERLEQSKPQTCVYLDVSLQATTELDCIFALQFST